MMTESHIIDDLYFEVPEKLQKIYTHFEPLSTKVVCENLQPGDTFLDIGANFGYFSLLAAHKVGSAGRVIAVEASPDVLPHLRKNLSQYKNIELLNCAVGKTKGITEFFLTEDFVNSGVSQSPFQNNGRKISVAMDTIDHLLEAHGNQPVHFIKCDVQGDEMAVLEGARRTISKAERLNMIIEWAPAWMKKAGYEPNEFPKFLQSLGFNSLMVVDDYLQKKMTIAEMEKEFEKDQTGRRFCNVLAVK
ncbi:MAG: FkbM family methyltransferase [Burkholderiales bacterium]|jgi:FkbM family methyltransferase|uniref:FkbM family methyltransferase n=1 Tax=Limnobacter sp. TaxID=2003368 RepID=UPI0039387194|nr:FkbM family methyltransferase [Burkholderiales bacterium]